MKLNSSLLLSTLLLASCAHVSPKVEEPEIISTVPGPFEVKKDLELVKSISVGDHPKSVTLSPDQTKAYVCNLEEGSVEIIDTRSLERIKRISFKRTPIEITDKNPPFTSFEEKPVEIAFTRDGRFVWISLLNAGGVAVYDWRGRIKTRGKESKEVRIQNNREKNFKKTRLRFIPTGKQPKIIAVSPDKKMVFVANWEGGGITVIDAETFKVLKKIPTGSHPRGICFTRSHAYVANFVSNTISEISLKTLNKTRNFDDVGKNPRHLVLSKDQKSIYVSNHGDGHIREIDIETKEVTHEWAVGKEPRTISLDENKNILFVTNYKDNSLTSLDLSKPESTFSINTLHHPVGAAFNRRDNTVWVSGYLDQKVNVYKFKSHIEKKTVVK